MGAASASGIARARESPPRSVSTDSIADKEPRWRAYGRAFSPRWRRTETTKIRFARSDCCSSSRWPRPASARCGTALYFLAGASSAAFGPLFYQVLTLGSVAYFMKTRNLARFRFRQELLILLAPIYIHIALGGFAASSGVVLWAFLAPLIAILFHGAKESLPWFLVLVAVVVVLAVVEPILARHAVPLPAVASIFFFVMNIVAVTSLVYAAIRYFAALLAAEKAEQVAAQRPAGRVVHRAREACWRSSRNETRRWSRRATTSRGSWPTCRTS